MRPVRTEDVGLPVTGEIAKRYVGKSRLGRVDLPPLPGSALGDEPVRPVRTEDVGLPVTGESPNATSGSRAWDVTAATSRFRPRR